MYYVYILKSLKYDKIYIGRTKNLKRRIQEHKSGKVWTTKRMSDVKLVFYEAFLSKQDSIRRERYLKTSKGRSALKMMIRESLKQYAQVAELVDASDLKSDELNTRGSSSLPLGTR